ncbi:hypothetical protein BDK51DRAFT_50517 [Blyttiomyces helicus]|uniref:Uncharacterized protein n=1 Tax=Blyttiomyces helicus TaxID=388810 RepID=A0A4P9W934_9FUNG|nr:hypothetical protein BDK51DRAFT_50517 [Blyttiomyces helicus]|eukprot:RKO87300.1 hypothetical protein BDK51DRAFT_50517 [Blyttiomyces helicus]
MFSVRDRERGDTIERGVLDYSCLVVFDNSQLFDVDRETSDCIDTYVNVVIRRFDGEFLLDDPDWSHFAFREARLRSIQEAVKEKVKLRLDFWRESEAACAQPVAVEGAAVAAPSPSLPRNAPSPPGATAAPAVPQIQNESALQMEDVEKDVSFANSRPQPRGSRPIRPAIPPSQSLALSPPNFQRRPGSLPYPHSQPPAPAAHLRRYQPVDTSTPCSHPEFGPHGRRRRRHINSQPRAPALRKKVHGSRAATHRRDRRDRIYCVARAM